MIDDDLTAWIQEFRPAQHTAYTGWRRKATELDSTDIEDSAEAAPQTRVWTASSGSPSIQFDPALLEEIRSEAVRALHGMGKGGIEIGGILLGQVEDGQITIRQWRPVHCDYSRGSSFLLSDRDVATLSCQIEAVQVDPVFAGLRVIGWFVSHTRGSLDPRIEESQLHTRLLNSPGSLLLILKPGRFGDAEIAIHSFETGDPPSLRPLDPILPVLANQTVKPPAVLNLDTPPPPLLSESRFGAEPPPSVPRRRWLAVTAAVAGIVFLTIGGISMWNNAPDRRMQASIAVQPQVQPAGPPRQLLSLHLEGIEDAIRVSWDTSSPVLKDAESGSLSVWDQDQIFFRTLSAEELRLGTIEYTRSLGEVRVQLTITTQQGKFSEQAHYAPFRVPEWSVSQPQ